MNLDQLKSRFNTGPALANRYQIDLPASPERSETLSILCDTVSWPGRQIFTQDVMTDLKNRKIAYGFDNEDVAISFLLTNDWSAWEYLHEWHQQIIPNIDGSRGFRIQFKSDYARRVTIHHLDTYGNKMKTLHLNNSYPITLDTIELGNANGNDIIRVSSTLTYDNWEIV